jgi:hypothetical protein
LPVTAAQSSSDFNIGTGMLLDTSAGLQYKAHAILGSTTIFYMTASTETVGSVLGNGTMTAALASGDKISANICYEAA